MKNPYLPVKQADYINWHDNLKTTATVAVPGVAAGDVTTMGADNADLHAKMGAATAADNAAIAAHAALNVSIATSQKHVRTMVKNVKNNPDFSVAQAYIMNIIGSEDTTDMTAQQPSLNPQAKANGVVELGFNKMLAEGVHIQSMRDGDAGFILLASETHSPYVDNRPLLVAGKPETRQYRAVFFMNKGEIGNMSDAVTAIAQP